MPRAKRGFKARRRKNRVLNLTEGFFGGRKNRWKQAREVLRHAWEYAYISRRLKKRDFRRLWITRINAGARTNGTSYSRLMHGLKNAKVTLDRKILRELAIHDPQAVQSSAKRASAESGRDDLVRLESPIGSVSVGSAEALPSRVGFAVWRER